MKSISAKKHVTNTRSSNSDESLKLVPHVEMSLEQCLEFISSDELVEVTPKSVRMRKKILNTEIRKKAFARSRK